MRRRIRQEANSSFNLTFCCSNLAANDFSFVHFNVRGFLSKQIYLEEVLCSLQWPSLVGLTETFLDESVCHISLSEYVLVSRRDRNSAGGGIALFAHKSIAPHIVHVANSDENEKSWHIFHSDQGPICIGLWYRPPHPGEVASISRFDAELATFAADSNVTLVMGDMNVHNVEWLTHSTSNSPEGRELHDVACSHGLRQYVKEPTRKAALLDLVLADCDDLLKVQVIPGVSDHHGVFGALNLTIPECTETERECFNYKKANWDNMRKEFAAFDWDNIFPSEVWSGDFQLVTPVIVDQAIDQFEAHLLRVVKRHVPHQKVRIQKQSHPWLDEECRRAIRDKYVSFGTAAFASKRDICTQVLRDGLLRHIAKTRDKLCAMKPSSKQWWKTANSLMMKSTGVSSIPPLLRDDNTWARDAESKAELLASTFDTKSALPQPSPNEFTPAEVNIEDLEDEIVRVSGDDVATILAKIREDSATGPDGVAARVLKRCRGELSDVFWRLSSGILAAGHWPRAWRLHWIHPIHKRKSKASAGNYRGVHITSQVSKVCERIIALSVRQCFPTWPRQFAYTPGRGHRDALLFNILTWLSWLEMGDLVLLYCSDVSGAFDKVCKELLVRKICGSRPPKCLAKFLSSWLDDRKSQVIVDGVYSKPMPLKNSVFQGTVLGPPLWNHHFADSKEAVRRNGFTETVFADDMNAFKRMRRTTPAEEIEQALQSCQMDLHQWGSGNRVTFDPGKESRHVIHRLCPERSEFKILGVVFDNHLLMHKAVRELARQGGWRLRAILRARRFFSTRQLVHLFKAQVLSYLESGSLAFIHAPPTTMAPVDRIVRRFLREVGLSEAEALLEYNLAPLESRRHIAALGVLHKRVLGILPESLADFFPLSDGLRSNHRTRLLQSRHNCQLRDPIRGSETQIYKRSVFGYVAIYNRLPQKAVNEKSLKGFQAKLQNAMRQALRLGHSDWASVFSFASRTSDIARFQRCFNEGQR